MTGLEMGLTALVVVQAGAMALMWRRLRRPSSPAVSAALDVLDEDCPPVRSSVKSPAAWAAAKRREVLIASLLDEWTEACVAASESGWVLGIPTGEVLLDAWARTATEAAVEEPAEAFGVWLVGQLGQSTRRGLKNRDMAAHRDVLGRALARAAGRLLKGLDEDLVIESRAPAGVGPRHRHAWLIDSALAEVMGRERGSEFLQPVVVLRPVLMRGDQVLLEGEVA